jgi:membrane protein implicated in regulation of membrane protease activity
VRFLILGLVAVTVFTVFVTVFAASADSRSVRALPKWAWVLICLFLPVLGGISYLIAGRPISSRGSEPRRPAPDDDSEFLNELRKLLDDE